MDMHHHMENVELSKDVAIGFKLTGYCDLELRRPGAVAHMSLHQKPTMSKSHPTEEADNNDTPIYTGGPVVRQMLATVAIGASAKPAAPRRWGPYMWGIESGQRLFAILFRLSTI